VVGLETTISYLADAISYVADPCTVVGTRPNSVWFLCQGYAVITQVLLGSYQAHCCVPSLRFVCFNFFLLSVVLIVDQFVASPASFRSGPFVLHVSCIPEMHGMLYNIAVLCKAERLTASS